MSSAAVIAPLPQEIQKTFLSPKLASLRVLTLTPFSRRLKILRKGAL